MQRTRLVKSIDKSADTRIVVTTADRLSIFSGQAQKRFQRRTDSRLLKNIDKCRHKDVVTAADRLSGI